MLPPRGEQREGYGQKCRTDEQAEKATDEILEAATHVFAMTEGHLAALEAFFPQHSDKLFLVREFSGITDKRQGTDVPDPIGHCSAGHKRLMGRESSDQSW